MKSFLTRLFSAVIGVAAIYALWAFLGAAGLKVLGLFAVAVGAWELTKILFKPTDSRLSRVFFYLFIVCIFVLSTLHPDHAGLIFAFFSICFCLVSLLSQKKFGTLDALTSFEAKSILGFFYIGLLPSFAVRILDLPQGMLWFVALLAIVFSGDVGAYLTGMMFGRHKLMPAISPKKTLEGAFGGLVASILVGVLFAQWLDQPSVFLALLAGTAGVIAQFGDLFESQLKRVADVKDSGRIMPGHGGVLDRIDGVLFASPVILFGALLLEGRFG